MPELREYLDTDGRSVFGRWFADLDAAAAARVATALTRLERGKFSNVEPVGEGMTEYKIDFGPGYRIYFGQDGGDLVILLAGGTKKRQSRDIAEAKLLWADYRRRRRMERRP
jgi:putative addiction module killer protein